MISYILNRFRISHLNLIMEKSANPQIESHDDSRVVNSTARNDLPKYLKPNWVILNELKNRLRYWHIAVYVSLRLQRNFTVRDVSNLPVEIAEKKQTVFLHQLRRQHGNVQLQQTGKRKIDKTVYLYLSETRDGKTLPLQFFFFSFSTLFSSTARKWTIRTFWEGPYRNGRRRTRTTTTKIPKVAARPTNSVRRWRIDTFRFIINYFTVLYFASGSACVRRVAIISMMSEIHIQLRLISTL